MNLMNSFTRALPALILAFLLSCQDGKVENRLDASLSASELPGSAGSIDLVITTNGKWTVTTSTAWLRPDAGTGTGDAVVKIVVSANDVTGERTATVTVKGETTTNDLTVKQRGLVLDISPASITFPEDASPATLYITSTREWEIRNAGDAAWCSFSQTKGDGNALITLTPAPLTDRLTPRGPVDIVIGSGNASKRLSLKQEFSAGEIYSDGEIVIYRQGTVANPVKIAVLGDGFIREDYRHGGAFDQAIGKMMDGFFEVEPFKTYKEYFTVYKIVAYSNERGATVEKAFTSGSKAPKQTRDTRFKSVLTGGGSTYISGDNDEVLAWARKVPGIDLSKSGIFLLVNLDAWAGTATSWTDGKFIARGTYDTNVVGRMLHEGGGHGFGRLKDEYINYETTIADSVKNVINTRQANGWWQYAGNVDLTGSLERVHWNHYFTISGYDRVNLFEGNCLYRYGAWKPESTSIMERSSYLYFSAPSREAIVRRVFERAGEEFDFDDFLARDVNTLPANVTRGVLAPEVLAEPVEL
ncbi:MAG: BACON domain-containing protein [Odoribacteraceae bacterium]|jgi:hypothetical protein|nr:BACON domain-containing protein [Odoribacteraceae bacterium]